MHGIAQSDLGKDKSQPYHGHYVQPPNQDSATNKGWLVLRFLILIRQISLNSGTQLVGVGQFIALTGQE